MTHETSRPSNKQPEAANTQPLRLPHPLGVLRMTSGTRKLSLAEILFALGRHRQGEWGKVSNADRDANNAALAEGGRVLSVHEAGDRTTFWIITEADRSSTIVLLPVEY